jgi:hypothetical protein
MKKGNAQSLAQQAKDLNEKPDFIWHSRNQRRKNNKVR